MKSKGFTVALQTIEVDDAQSVDEAVFRIKEDFGRLDILGNNAGKISDGEISILNVKESIFKETFETNFFGALRLIQGIVPILWFRSI